MFKCEKLALLRLTDYHININHKNKNIFHIALYVCVRVCVLTWFLTLIMQQHPVQSCRVMWWNGLLQSLMCQIDTSPESAHTLHISSR